MCLFKEDHYELYIQKPQNTNQTAIRIILELRAQSENPERIDDS